MVETEQKLPLDLDIRGGIMNTYKIKFDFEIEVNCEQENINDEVLKWWISASENLYPFYKIETISQEGE